MRRHLEHLFGGDLDGLHEGLIELAWTDTSDGSLRHAALFGTDELDALVESAMARNRVPGQNVYVGPALRRPGVARGSRCSDADVLALTAYYADLDDDVLTSARGIYRAQGCPPTAAVVTGRQPHTRAQLLWRLETPERDAGLCRRQNLALAQALGGDTSVVNPSRVLRLAGSLAWPLKPGRVLERTELQTFEDGRPRRYLPGQIARAFPPAAEASARDQEGVAGTQQRADTASEDDLLLGGVSVAACLARIRQGDHWHDNLVRLTGHWIARGWADAEILTLAESLTRQGYTVEQTRREVARMIAGGRQKWGIPDPQHRVDDQAPLPLAPAWVEDLAPTLLPRRRWLLGRRLLRGHLTLRVAPGGVGKSTLAIEEAVAIATGRDLVAEPVHETARVWIYNNEDDRDELDRRLSAVLQRWDVPLAEIRGRLALNSGADRPLLVARADRAGTVLRLPDVDGCIEHIRRHEIGLFVVDPFIETHGASENSNEQIRAVAALFRDIARQGRCAVMLVHHTGKPAQGASDGHAGNMNAARGASALVGVARVVQTLFAMSRKDAEELGLSEEERHLYVRLDEAKANLGPPGIATRWFVREAVAIGNGDEVGVLVPSELLGFEAARAGNDTPGADRHQELMAALLRAVPVAEISLNAAARSLAWSGDPRFERYRQTDARGHQRVQHSLRGAILAACRRGTVVVEGGSAQGFTCDETRSPVTLKRFSRPAGAHPAAQPPEFEEEP